MRIFIMCLIAVQVILTLCGFSLLYLGQLWVGSFVVVVNIVCIFINLDTLKGLRIK